MDIMEGIGKALTRVFRTSSERYVKKRQDFITAVNEWETRLAEATDDELRAKTAEFRRRIQEHLDQVLDQPLRQLLRELALMPEEARKPAKLRLTERIQASMAEFIAEAFAVVREASDRHLGVRNVFDDQFAFDANLLSPEMRRIFDQAKKLIAGGENRHQVPLPPPFYAELRRLFPVDKRPPFRFRHFDVQILGGDALYEGTIAEMATGEGKTLVATLAAYVVALSGRKVHIITVNDYLAQRDRDWMGPVYEALGLTVGAIQSAMDTAGDERKNQYSCDITYGTNNEFGFDYLRDNMKTRAADQVQGPLDYAIIDEVDSILIDEARTPLIISGPAFDDTSRYKQADQVARELIGRQRKYADLAGQIDQAKRRIANTEGEISEAKKARDAARQKKAETQLAQSRDRLEELEAQLAQTTQFYEVEYDRHSVHLTHEGIGAAQEIAGVGSFYVGANMDWPHLLEQSLRAHIVFEREKEYVVQNGEVIIVDEFTGRLMHGRQWSDGLHQAVEAKENVHVKEESQTLATITIQNFFKLYQQLAGMTGTALTEADEFMKIYQLNVVSIPTNKPVIREDRDDLIYKSIKDKFEALVEEIFAVSKSGRPILVGTTSIEKNEALSAALIQRYGLDHEVLNAKQHAREAAIIAKAGHRHQGRDGSWWGNITIATNMAGRGTDIKLGAGVVDQGGLHVLGTERHEARRIDNQLRGRTGRQGDPGSSQFFLSFDDDLMRIFAPEWTVKALAWIGWQEGEPIYHRRISKGVEKAQKKVEQRNFEARKSLLEYDEVMDYQRQVFYTRRQALLEGRGLEGTIWEMIDEVMSENCRTMLSGHYPYQCIAEWARTTLGIDVDLDRLRDGEQDEIEELLRDRARDSAEQDILMTLGEYMGEELDDGEWDLRGLSKWAMSKFGVNISQNQLRKMNPEQVQAELIEAAQARIQKFDFAKIASFLDERFALNSLCDWVNQKFVLSIKPSDLRDRKPEAIEEFLLQEARQAYRRREIEYPVDFILNVALRRQQAHSSFAAQEVADWANRKFQADWTMDQIQNLSYDKIRRKLLDLSESFYNGRLDAEIDQALGRYRQDAGQLAEWARQRFEAEIRPDQVAEEPAARDLLRRRARQFLRRELTDLERYVLLQIYDSTWKDHLYAMDHLKSGIGLRGFAERDPKIEYKREGFQMFQQMLRNIRDKVTDIIFKARLESEQTMRSVWNVSATSHAEYAQFQAQREAAQAPQGEQKVKTIVLEKPKVGRNDPCPCGSGKKYKKCCGRNA
ncbi:MAG: SEC-C domain-containing protein [Sedimentisphaerales bacterium]|nr:SEC-C domain-containing protein [Sedimentisphaerales bacterium]